MNILPTFGFKGMILPVVDSTDKFYLLIENDNDHRVLLNLISSEINKFVNIESKSSKIIRVGSFKSNIQLKVFYMGQELFDFFCDEIKKQHILIYSDYILKKEMVAGDISFYSTFTNGVKVESVSDKPQSLYITITNKDTNEILCEDNFISNEPYVFNNNKFVNYNISVYNADGQKIYKYDLDLKDKMVWIKLESVSIGETIAWIPYVEEFRKKHQCKLFCTTYWNNLFVTEYSNIKFIGNDEVIDLNTLFAAYKIKHSDSEEKIQRIASESLGTEIQETKLNEVLEHIKEISISNTS